MKFSRILLFASAAMLPAAPALAQEDESDIVVVATGVEQPAQESGRAVTVFGREDLDRVQAVTVSDVLSTVPGISATRNGGIGGFTGVRVRGAEGEQTLVLIDGVRVNDPSSPGGGFDFGNLLAGAVDRVEVLRGPNSTVWGSQAIGGVVNVVTMDGGDGFGLRAGAEGGSFGTLSGNAAIRGGNARIRGSLTAGYFTTDGISAKAGGAEADGYRQYGATGRVEAFITPEISVDLRGYYADSRAALDGFPPPTYAIFSDTAEYSTAKEMYGYAGLHAALFDGTLDNELAVTAGDIDRNNYDPAAGAAPIFFGKGSSERYTYRGNLRVAEQFRFVVGVEHEDSRFTDGSVAKGTGITSYFAETIIRPSDMVTINAGVRQDEHRDFGSHTSFAVSGSIRPSAGTVVRINYGEGFKAPTLYQLHGGFVGNANLQPEVAESYEVGVDQQAGPVRLSATWFHRNTTNQIDFDLGTFTYGNIAATRTQGIELEAAVSTGGLTLSANYTHLDPENRSAGPNLRNDLARRPRDFANFSADYRFPFDLSIGASVQWRGDSFDNAANTVPLKSYTLVNIRAEMPVSDRFSLYGRVDNLLDEQYQTVAGYGTPGVAAYAGVRVKFD